MIRRRTLRRWTRAYLLLGVWQLYAHWVASWWPL